MSLIKKLVIYVSEAALEQHAAGYPCLVNYNPFTRTGEIDDGCGHYAHVTFVAVDPETESPDVLAWAEFDNVELIGFPMPATFVQGK
jgi:hypothetical protein